MLIGSLVAAHPFKAAPSHGLSLSSCVSRCYDILCATCRWILPGTLTKARRHGTEGHPSKAAGNPSKHELPSPPSPPGNPRTPEAPQRGATTSKGLRPGWTRATFIVREETVQQLKAVAYWDRKELKKVVEEAFRAYLKDNQAKPVPASSED